MKGKVICENSEVSFTFPYDFPTFLSLIRNQFVSTTNSNYEFAYFNVKGEKTLIRNQQEYETALKDSMMNSSFRIYLSPTEKIQKADVQEQEDYFECLACNGTKVNRKGMACKKCNGTGRLNPAWQAKLERMIERKISTMFSSAIEKQASQLLQSMQSQTPGKLSQVLAQSRVLKPAKDASDHLLDIDEALSRIIEPTPKLPEEKKDYGESMEESKSVIREEKLNVKKEDYDILDELMDAKRCKACEAYIAKASHKKCPVCLDYTLCTECADDLLHEHALEDVISSAAVRESKISEAFRDMDAEVQEDRKFEMEKGMDGSITKPALFSLDIPEEVESLVLPPAPVSHYVDNIKIYCSDPKTVNESAPNEVFTKTWTFVNKGVIEWPNMEFITSGENKLKAEWKEVSKTAPGSTCIVSLNLVAPAAAGTYEQFFTFQLGGNQVGDKVSVVVKVVDSAANSEKRARAKAELEKLKAEENIPEMYEENLLYLIENSNEDPKWVLSLLRDNSNNLELIKDLVFT